MTYKADLAALKALELDDHAKLVARLDAIGTQLDQLTALLTPSNAPPSTPVATDPPAAPTDPVTQPSTPPVVVPPAPTGAYTPLFAEDFSGFADDAAVQAKYGNLQDAGYNGRLFSLATINGQNWLQYNIKKGNPASPIFEVIFGAPKPTHIVERWDQIFPTSWHVANVNGGTNNPGYKWPSEGWVGAESRAGIDMNGDMLDTSIGVKYSDNTWGGPLGTLVKHCGLHTQWSDGNVWTCVRECCSENGQIYTRFWAAPEGMPLVLYGGANASDPLWDIPAGQLVYPMSTGRAAPAIDRFRLGENYNQIPDSDLVHYATNIEIVDVHAVPDILTRWGAQ